MNYSIKRISLDVHSPSSNETVNIKRGDTARRICISLVDGGMPYTISEDCSAVFTAKKPDGTVVYNDCSIENNTIIYNVTEQTVALEGRVNCEIKLYGADGKLITSPKFTILVFGTVYNEGDEIESKDEVSELKKLIAEVNALKDSIGNLSNGSAIKLASIDLLASKWTGSESPYSQVVSIPGVTANSQVDLTPSVEQMTIFYDKDITFITENDGGVVTVYVIGQKPQNDYTIQANIVEVKV